MSLIKKVVINFALNIDTRHTRPSKGWTLNRGGGCLLNLGRRLI